MSDEANAFLQSTYAEFPEARLKGLGVTEPLLTTYRNSWNSQSDDWKFNAGVNYASQSDAWVLASLSALPAPLAVRSLAFIGPNPPPSPSTNTLWYDSGVEILKRWSGTAWLFSAGGAGGGVTSVNGTNGAVVITAAGLGAILSSTLGASGGTAQLDSTGKVPLAQSRVSSVAGKTGAVTLAVADVVGAVSSASVGASGGVASLDATGKIPLTQMPAGYTGGGGTGTGAVSSVAGKTGVVTLSVGDVTNAAALDPSTGRLSLAQLPARFAMTVGQSGKATVGAVNGQGTPIPYDTTTTYVVLTASRPPVGGSGVVVVRTRTHATQTASTLATLTLPPYTRRVVVPVTSGGVLTNGDNLLVNVTQVGTTLPGGDYTVQVLGVGADPQPGFLTAPGTPSNMTVTAVAGGNQVTWAAPTTGGPVSVYHVYRSDNVNPLGWIGDVEAPAAIFTDTTAVSGTAYSYQIMASNDDFTSTLVSSRTFTYFSQADGNPNGFTPSVGTNSPASLTVSTNSLNVATGGIGNNAPQDRVWLGWTDPGTGVTYSALRWQFPIIWGDSRNILDLYMSANQLTGPASGWTAGWQIEMTPTQYRIAGKFPGINAGAFTNLTLTGSGQATTTAANGNVAWTGGSMNANGTSVYVITVELLLNQSDGSTSINLYHSTLANAGAQTLDNTVSVTAAQRAAVPSGYYGMMFNGNQSTTAVSITYKIPTASYPMTMVPLSNAGA